MFFLLHDNGKVGGIWSGERPVGRRRVVEISVVDWTGPERGPTGGVDEGKKLEGEWLVILISDHDRGGFEIYFGEGTMVSLLARSLLWEIRQGDLEEQVPRLWVNFFY